MKHLKDIVEESLIKSYDHNKLIKKLESKYNAKFYVYDSTSNVKSFYFDIDDISIVYEDQSLCSLLNFYGYVFSEITYSKKDKIYRCYIEPIFGEKIKSKDIPNGMVFHITHKDKVDSIKKYRGLLPVEGTYRKYNERVYFFYGKSVDEIIERAEYIIKQLQLKEDEYVIIKVDVSKYNVDFYKDTSNKVDGMIYANAIFFPHLITRYNSVEKLKNDLSIFETKYVMIGKNKIFIRNVETF